MSPFVSIIVAVYQVENYIQRCLDSILTQSLRDFELILVDDGSTDTSAEICNRYALNDSRIKIFRKEHTGLSDTRQVGLNNAIGDFVIHCDSDDWIDQQMLETLYKKACETNADIVVCDYIEEYNERQILHREFPLGIPLNNNLLQNIQYLSFSLCNKLVRRRFLDSNRIRCLQGISYAEDMYVTFQMLNSSPTLAYVPMPFYHYNRISENSLTLNCTNEWLVSHRKVSESLKGVLKEPLLRILDSNKCNFILNVFNAKMFDNEKIRTIYPEVHEMFLYSSLSSPKNYPLIAVLFRWKLIFYVPKIFVYVLKRIKDKLISNS